MENDFINKAKQTLDQVTEKAKDVSSKTSSVVSSITGQMIDEVESIKDDVSSKVSSEVGKVTKKGRDAVKNLAKEIISESIDETLRVPFIKKSQKKH